MLLYPASKTMIENQTLVNLSISHRKIKPTNNANKKGKASPRTAITHESAGLMYGQRQESKYKTAVIILSTTRVRLVIMRRRDGINASYESPPVPLKVNLDLCNLFLENFYRLIFSVSYFKSSLLAFFNRSFSSEVRELKPCMLILSSISSIRCCERLGVFV